MIPPRSRSLLGVALLALILAAPASGDDLVLGKKKGEWIDSLKTEKEAKRRRAAVIALGIVGATQDDVDRVLGDTLANDEAPEVRQQVLLVVRNLRKEQLGKWTQRMGQVLKYDKHAPNRMHAASILGKLEDLAKPVLSNILAACKDPDASVRAAIVETVGRIGPDASDAVPELIAMLKDKDFAVRVNTVATLGKMAEIAPQSVPELLALLSTETDTELRKEIVRVLALFGPASKAAVPALVKVLREDKSEEIRQQAVRSLGKIGADARGELDALKAVMAKDADKTVRLYLIRTLTSILGDDAPQLAKDYAAQLSAEKDTDLKLAILQELAAMGNGAKDALPTLKATLEDPSVSVRREAKLAIERITAKPPPKKEEKKDEKDKKEPSP
jgi:HEAT repeat protein